MMEIEKNRVTRDEVELGSSEAILSFQNLTDGIVSSEKVEIPMLKAKWLVNRV